MPQILKSEDERRRKLLALQHELEDPATPEHDYADILEQFSLTSEDDENERDFYGNTSTNDDGKAHTYCYLINRGEEEAKRMRKIAAQFAAKARAIEAINKMMMEKLNEGCYTFRPDDKKHRFGMYSLTMRTSQDLIVEDINLLPDDLVNKTVRVKDIKAAIKNGIDLKGVHLEPRRASTLRSPLIANEDIAL